MIEDEVAAAETEERRRAGGSGAVIPGPAKEQMRDEDTARHEHFYRDQRRGAERAVREARLTEVWMHRLYRRLRGHPFLGLNAQQEVAVITDRWRERQLPGDPPGRS